MADHDSHRYNTRRDSERPQRQRSEGARRESGHSAGGYNRRTGEFEDQQRPQRGGGYRQRGSERSSERYGGERGERGYRGSREGRSDFRERSGRGDYRTSDREDRGGYRDARREDSRGSRGSYRDDRSERPGRGDNERHSDRRSERRDDRGGQRGNNHRGGGRGHAQRAGAGRRKDDFRAGPQRAGFREERIKARTNEPDLPDDITASDLDASVRQDLRSLSKDNAEAVGRHMVMAALLMADDPQLALRHARAAKDRAGRVAVVRETCGIAAYHAGEWKEALAELRAARRMSGGPGLLAVMADCERGLGRPARAIEMARNEDTTGLDDEALTELSIVVAGARMDMGDPDMAVVELQRENLDPARTGMSAARLFYVYADALVAAGRTDEARTWFEHCEHADIDGYLDAAERRAAL